MPGCVLAAFAAIPVAADDGVRFTEPPYDPELSTETGTSTDRTNCVNAAGAPADWPVEVDWTGNCGKPGGTPEPPV
jgi:hypothetical protein